MVEASSESFQIRVAVGETLDTTKTEGIDLKRKLMKIPRIVTQSKMPS